MATYGVTWRYGVLAWSSEVPTRIHATRAQAAAVEVESAGVRRTGD